MNLKNYHHDAWKIIEKGFDADNVRASESIFSIGNGLMGQRANFEEAYSGKTLHGSYVAGVYYPDKTRVGWWKNGYPEYFAKVLNSAFWIGIKVFVDGEELDLITCKVLDFYRELNMHEGTLIRTFTVEMPSGKQISVEAKRFLSLVDTEMGVINYSVKAVNGDCTIMFEPYINGDVKNEDSNYDEKFWTLVSQKENYLQMQTKKTAFDVAWRMQNQYELNHKEMKIDAKPFQKDALVGEMIEQPLKKGDVLTIKKYVAVLSSQHHNVNDLERNSVNVLEKAVAKGYEKMVQEHVAAWAKKWEGSDIQIEGDIAAQQGIRFNIFQLNQTYTGEDERLNIGPKGFTGEKYGGSTYWDTEAYCLPFYMATAGEDVAKQLLIYRHKQLQKAIENGQKLGFSGGAALYPMVTMNGEECHNEWEITFEEIHRNGAIAFAIYNYARFTGDKTYYETHGLEVLIGISRFWKQRVNFSEEKQKYVMLGVTGPNEYENNINNNWYTLYIARWTMLHTIEMINFVKRKNPSRWAEIARITSLNEGETAKWQTICDNLYLPEDKKLGIFLQQDGYMDKEQILVKDLPASERPINQKWSWDRILRSCFIKQADVLQGIYLFENDFDIDTIRRNYDFYEARTVHESSLSPCVHSILAAKINDMERAYNLYLRTARLDLDDYNKEVHEGLHITSMAGTWLSIVEGFAGMRVKDDMLYFHPQIPASWKSYTFKIMFRGRILNIHIQSDKTSISLVSGEPLDVVVNGTKQNVR